MNTHQLFTQDINSLAKASTDCLIVGIFHEGILGKAAQAVDREGVIAKLVKEGDFDGKEGKTHLLHAVPGIVAKRVMLVGLGSKDKKISALTRAKHYLSAHKAVGKALKSAHYTKIIDALAVEHDAINFALTQGITALERALNSYPAVKKEPPKKQPPKTFSWVVGSENSAKAAEIARQRGVAMAQGMEKMLLLANHPANICTPSTFAEFSSEFVKEINKADRDCPLSINVLKPEALKKLGMWSFLGVAKGSEEPARLVEIRYQGSVYANATKSKKTNKMSNPVVLVGKGITFDSGGISLKPGADMDHMKWDMTGAATVVGALLACARMKLPMDVVGIAPLCENMPSGRASHPSDVVRSMNGLTIENLNTDAEGRLILCDALTYAQRQYQASALIDIATLTGACVIALGDVRMALYSNHQPLGEAIFNAGEQAGDLAWKMPTDEDYLEGMKSNFADIANISGRSGGSVTAAMFLSKFIDEGTRWAHLDIAGVAYQGNGADKGATGRPLPLIMQYLMNVADKK